MAVALYADMSYTNGDWIQFTTAETAQTSFYKTGSSDVAWRDLVTVADSTFRIKAYTSNADASENGELISIALDKTSLTMEAGNTAQLNVSYLPSYTTDDKTITWSTDNANIATVDGNGKVTAKSAGSTVITATCGTKTATCNVVVRDLRFTIQNINNESGTFTVRTSRLNELANASGVRVAVWSAENGQDDLVWYSMKYYGANTWGINVPIYNHKSKGTYYAHMYLENANGNAFFGGSTTFTVH